MIEQRAKPRTNICLEANWDGRSGNCVARMTDLSETGCYVDSFGDVKVGEILGFEIQLPGGEWLYLEGEVTHAKPSLGFGVRFIDLDTEQVQKIRGVIEMAETPAGRYRNSRSRSTRNAKVLELLAIQ
jgi:hypothetical protein